jgi:hypothetical protein
MDRRCWWSDNHSSFRLASSYSAHCGKNAWRGRIDNRGFADAAAAGDWVSVHWGWVCERVTDLEQRQLERSTRYHLPLANATL